MSLTGKKPSRAINGERLSNTFPTVKIMRLFCPVTNDNYMFKNYFKIAWRNLLRNKSYAAINITGLAVGIGVCLLIFIIIQYQTNFDTFHSKKRPCLSCAYQIPKFRGRKYHAC